jgi:acyl-CoA reductase-like NAD-dependent aldehyde dehydrogenase
VSIVVQHDLIVEGRRESGRGEPIEVRYPFTGEVTARVAAASPADIERAIAAALEAFHLYRNVPAHRRSTLLHGVSQLVDERREELARDITLETGKAVWESRLECERAVNTFRIAAEEATRIDGEIVPLPSTRRSTSSRTRWRRLLPPVIRSSSNPPRRRR